MEQGRRAFVAGMAMLPCAPRAALAADASPVDRLHAFLVATVGRPAPERLAIAQRTLDGLTPLATETLLVEIAAIGALVRGSSTRSALRAGYPKRSREALDKAAVTLAGAGWPRALDGAWHYEVSRRSRIGAMVFNASRSKGDALFAEAARLDPRDGGIRLTQAVALLGVDDDGASRRAEQVLRAVPPAGATPYAALVSAQARRLLQLLQEGGVQAAADHALTIF